MQMQAQQSAKIVMNRICGAIEPNKSTVAIVNSWKFDYDCVQIQREPVYWHISLFHHYIGKKTVAQFKLQQETEKHMFASFRRPAFPYPPASPSIHKNEKMNAKRERRWDIWDLKAY
jgi:hypothetical protein